MKSHNITLFNFLSILCCFGLSLLFFSCSGLGGEKTSGAVSFSFDARSLVSSLEENLQENDIPSDSLQEVKIQIALLGSGGGDAAAPQTITFTEEDINSDFQTAKVEFADIEVGSSVYARGLIYALVKDESLSSAALFPFFYGSSEEITVKADSNNLPLKLTSLVSNNSDYEWEASGITSDGKREFMFLVFKSGTYILSEIGSAVPSFGTYQAKSYDEKTGLPTEFQLTETVYQPAESNDYVIVQTPEEKSISVIDGKFSFTSASGLEVSFEKIVLNSYDPDDPDIPSGEYPYEIQFWLKKDGATGTAESDYTCLTDYSISGSFTLSEGSQAKDIIESMTSLEIEQKVAALNELGYIPDEDKSIDVNNKTDGSVVICYYLKPTYASSGSISLKPAVKRYTLAKNEAASEKFYLNKGRFAFSLLDEDGNDVLADVDWDNQSNAQLMNVSYDLTYKNSRINRLREYGFNYCRIIDSDEPLTKAGTYLLTVYVSAREDSTTYITKSNESITIPYFEPISGTFEIEVEDYRYAELDFTGIDSEGISAALTNALSGLTTGSSNVYFKLCGQTTKSYTDIFSDINNAIESTSSLYFIDASELTTTSESKEIGQSVMYACSTVQGLILPEDVEQIYGQAFAYCSNLESVVFGRFLKGISTAFEACAKLSSVTFPEDSSFESLGSRSFSECSALKTFKLPASIKDIGPGAFYHSAIVEFALEDTSGTWYYTFDSTTYGKLINGTLEPESVADGSCGLVTDLQTVTPSNSNQATYTFPEGTSLTQKLTWLAKQTSNTSADFTKEIYLFHKSE